jgi:RNA polymerase sigma factor (TIGR02999 family)
VCLFVPTICGVYPQNHWSTGANIGNVPGRNDEISELLRAWGDGDREAAERFMPLIYDELRRQARRHLNRERANHTLQTTALVHEAFIRLNEQHGVKWQNRTHFLALAAQMMRRILVNYAIAQKREKRGGAAGTIQLEETLRIAVPEGDVDVPALDEALTRLEKLDARQSRIVEFRFFSGLSIEETAEVLSISPATVKREWSMAKAWLRRELTGDPE